MVSLMVFRGVCMVSQDVCMVSQGVFMVSWCLHGVVKVSTWCLSWCSCYPFGVFIVSSMCPYGVFHGVSWCMHGVSGCFYGVLVFTWCHQGVHMVSLMVF